jgi:hypothetical protein
MDDQTTTEFVDSATTESGPCTKPFLLRELVRGHKDKLGNEVIDILWIGRNYAIYRSEKGVYVQFSDCPREEAVQRGRFSDICPELCELRYLTYQMRSGWNFRFKPRSSWYPSSLYDHNIAQAVMLVMEQKVEAGKRLAQQALDMAVQRVTNDNTVRYLCCCLICWIAAIILIGVSHLLASSQELRSFLIAGIAGATGAVLSVATRLQAFELRPCNQSNMNYWMSGIRVGIGVLAGAILLLLAPTILSNAMTHLVPHMPEQAQQAQQAEFHWQTAAVLGLLGGFAERFVPNLLLRTIDKVESSVGTPAQAVRGAEANPAGR